MSQCLDILTDRWGNPLSRARRLAMAHDYWCRFCDILRKGSVGYPSDLSNLRNLYVYLDRALPRDVEQAIMDPGSSLRGLAFDAFAGQLCDRAGELPEAMRAECRRRRWIQLAKQGRCSPSEFADGMLRENSN